MLFFCCKVNRNLFGDTVFEGWEADIHLSRSSAPTPLAYLVIPHLWAAAATVATVRSRRSHTQVPLYRSYVASL